MRNRNYPLIYIGVKELSCHMSERPLNVTVHFKHVYQRLFGDNTFYYLLFLDETFMMCVNVFYVTRNETQLYPTKMRKG